MTRKHTHDASRSGRTGVDAGFYIDHVDHVRMRLRRLGISSVDIDDLVQQTFIVAQRCWSDRPRGHGRIRAWMGGIAWRIGMNFRRTESNRHEFIGGLHLSSLTADGPNPEVAVAQQQIQSAILAGMTSDERELLCDCLFEDVTIDELAARHGLARSTAWAKVQRLRRNALDRFNRLTA